MSKLKKIKPKSFLKFALWFGAIADFIVGTFWLLAVLGYSVPDPLTGYIGQGQDYRIAMYIATIFMYSWGALLYWGTHKPLQRKGLLAITAALIFISLLIDLTLRRSLYSGTGFTIGIINRLFLVSLFTSAVIYSNKKSSKQ